MDSEPVTLLLQRAGAGEVEAAERLYALVYADLRKRAGELMVRQTPGHTLQPTAVVHEAWIKLCAPESSTEGAAARAGTEWRERGHFLAVASRAMRSVLVDHARSRGAERRGGDRYRIDWDDALSVFDDRALDVLALDAALERFAQLDPELARIVELRFFGGLTIRETAEVLELSTATVDRGWRTARAWLRAELEGGAEGEGSLGS